MISYDERGVIEDVELFDKDVILCAVCGRRVAVTERDPDEGGCRLLHGAEGLLQSRRCFER